MTTGVSEYLFDILRMGEDNFGRSSTPYPVDSAMLPRPSLAVTFTFEELCDIPLAIGELIGTSRQWPSIVVSVYRVDDYEISLIPDVSTCKFIATKEEITLISLEMDLTQMLENILWNLKTTKAKVVSSRQTVYMYEVFIEGICNLQVVPMASEQSYLTMVYHSRCNHTFTFDPCTK